MSSKQIRVRSKFLFEGPTKFLLRGVSYGTFAPDHRGEQFPPLECIARDFASMRAYGINTVRTYTVPSPAILDAAWHAGLRLMVGLPWMQHVAFLDEQRVRREIRRNLVAEIERLRDHPAVLMCALGNEIPAAVVRWHGQARTEQFLRELHDAAKNVAPDGLFTYVNFPPTEYLELPFLDVCAFNVYLHREADLRRYLARLQHIAGHLPLLVAEAGADSIREGVDGQAALTAMQLRAAFSEGACGAIAFAWTDQWWRGGHAVDDWAFGLVDHDRRPKPTAESVARVFLNVPFSEEQQRAWPNVSVVVCAYNAAETLDECLTSLEQLTYPDYEVIVVNDGSKDETGAIAKRHPTVRVIDTPNNGLSTARNIGLSAAAGSIVAYCDADVRVDCDWLTYLVQPFLTSDVAAAGGPNVVPADDPWVAQCVARAPGGPTHVMFDDRIAEHVPGCNLAIRRDALLAIGGFNPIYLRAGDDVDVCWRLQARGWKLGFAPAALVWHRHRPSVRAYWRQQVGYGEGEVWLQPHHPDKFVGSKIRWHGHIYSALPFVRSLTGLRVNAGPWGTAPFPSVYRTDVFPFAFLPHSVAWQSVAVTLMLAGLLMSFVLPEAPGVAVGGLGFLAMSITMLRCIGYAWASDIRSLTALPGCTPTLSNVLTRGLIAWLHFIQPLARARGRLRGMLSAPEFELASNQVAHIPSSWRDLGDALASFATRRRVLQFWSESWASREMLLTHMVDRFRSTRAAAALELDDGWHRSKDVSLQLGRWAWLDVRMLVEEHELGKVLVRVGRCLRLTPFFALSVSMFAVSLIAAGSGTALGWLAMTIALSLAMLMCRGLWRAAATVNLADRVITSVLLDAGAIPLGAAAERIAARLVRADVAPTVHSPLRPADMSDDAPRTLAPMVHTARHAG
jgi:GT2 family glycosyltransferase